MTTDVAVVSDVQNAVDNKTPLEDLMVAMDIVDTVRHQQSLIDRELDDDARRARLLKRLRELYRAQGIDVPDHVLYEGIAALEEERFKYQPVKESFSTKLAHWYVRRKKWGKPFSIFAMFTALVSSVHFFNDVLPEKQARQALPSQIDSVLQEIQTVAKNPEIVKQAKERAESATAAINSEKFDVAESLHSEMDEVAQQLQLAYKIKVVSRPNESSGVWRVPDVNDKSKNYYLIVEAIDNKGKVVKLPIVNEETGKRSQVGKWGLRVNENTFYSIAADKNDDGIIQGNIMGEKQVGYLQPKFIVPTTGATITEW